jgi:FkbM family methyltransferase
LIKYRLTNYIICAKISPYLTNAKAVTLNLIKTLSYYPKVYIYIYIIDFVKFRKLISAYKTKLFGNKANFAATELLGKALTIAEGTINKKADKDDAWWYALAQKHDIIFDIGANIGYSTLLATLHNPEKTIILADPNPDALAIARQNLEKNNLAENKQYINAFVGAKKGEQVKFYTLGTGSAGSMFGSHADSAKSVNAHYMVNTTTVDDIIADTGIMPSLIKVDVEAAESYVLQGATTLATKQHTTFMVEMHAPPEMPMLTNAQLILDWCAAYNYKAYYLKEHTLLLNAQQIAHRGRCHLLLLPVDISYPEYLNAINEGDEIA